MTPAKAERTDEPSPSDGRVRPSPVAVPEPQKAAELIADHLRRDIASGKLKAGDALPPEGVLISHFGVSLPTLRSAFRILESEGLISISRGSQGGPRVRHPGADVVARNFGMLLELRGTEMSDFLYASRVIEPAAAGLLAQEQPAEAIELLEGLVAQEKATIEEDPVGFAQAAMAVYHAVTEHCSSNILAAFGAVLNVLFPKAVDYAVRSLGNAYPDELREINRRLVADHTQLVRLIRQGNSSRATKHWDQHLTWLADITAQFYPELLGLRFSAFELDNGRA